MIGRSKGTSHPLEMIPQLRDLKLLGPPVYPRMILHGNDSWHILTYDSLWLMIPDVFVWLLYLLLWLLIDVIDIHRWLEDQIMDFPLPGEATPQHNSHGQWGLFRARSPGTGGPEGSASFTVPLFWGFMMKFTKFTMFTVQLSLIWIWKDKQ